MGHSNIRFALILTYIICMPQTMTSAIITIKHTIISRRRGSKDLPMRLVWLWRGLLDVLLLLGLVTLLLLLPLCTVTRSGGGSICCALRLALCSLLFSLPISVAHIHLKYAQSVIQKDHLLLLLLDCFYYLDYCLDYLIIIWVIVVGLLFNNIIVWIA